MGKGTNQTAEQINFFVGWFFPLVPLGLEAPCFSLAKAAGASQDESQRAKRRPRRPRYPAVETEPLQHAPTRMQSKAKTRPCLSAAQKEEAIGGKKGSELRAGTQIGGPKSQSKG